MHPNFAGTFLSLYQEGQELAATGKVAEGAQRWRVLAGQLPGSSTPWLSTWLFLHAAGLLAEAKH